MMGVGDDGVWMMMGCGVKLVGVMGVGDDEVG